MSAEKVTGRNHHAVDDEEARKIALEFASVPATAISVDHNRWPGGIVCAAKHPADKSGDSCPEGMSQIGKVEPK